MTFIARDGDAGRYVVGIDDNFHYMDPAERYRDSAHATAEAAIERCRSIVRDFIDSTRRARPDFTGAELLDQYVAFGEDPWVLAPKDADRVAFSGWNYAAALCGQPNRFGPPLVLRDRSEHGRLVIAEWTVAHPHVVDGIALVELASGRIIDRIEAPRWAMTSGSEHDRDLCTWLGVRHADDSEEP